MTVEKSPVLILPQCYGNEDVDDPACITCKVSFMCGVSKIAKEYDGDYYGD